MSKVSVIIARVAGRITLATAKDVAILIPIVLANIISKIGASIGAKVAIMAQALYMYENRGDAQRDTLQGTSPVATLILNTIKRV